MTDASPRFDATRFRHVIGHFMSGVTVITTRHDERDHGMTASAVSSLSLDPPMVTVCLHRSAPTQDAVLRSGAFAVNVLREGQDDVATRFATPHDDKFAGLGVRYGLLGQPLLEEALATMECAVTETVVGGTHRVFLATVRDADVRPGSPLAYYRGRFGRLELADDDATLAQVRHAVLRRLMPIGEPIDIPALAGALDAPDPAVEFALARLLAEGLVARQESGYRQVPLDAARSDETFAAKLVIDLGAARMAVGHASDEELDRLNELAGATAPAAGAIDAGAGETLVAANESFHEAVIAAGGNRPLLDAYRRLRLPAVLSPVIWRDQAAARRLAAEHVEIAHALRARNLIRVEHLVTAHNQFARAAHRQAIAAAGGQV